MLPASRNCTRAARRPVAAALPRPQRKQTTSAREPRHPKPEQLKRLAHFPERCPGCRCDLRAVALEASPRPCPIALLEGCPGFAPAAGKRQQVVLTIEKIIEHRRHRCRVSLTQRAEADLGSHARKKEQEAAARRLRHAPYKYADSMHATAVARDCATPHSRPCSALARRSHARARPRPPPPPRPAQPLLPLRRRRVPGPAACWLACS